MLAQLQIAILDAWMAAPPRPGARAFCPSPPPSVAVSRWRRWVREGGRDGEKNRGPSAIFRPRLATFGRLRGRAIVCERGTVVHWSRGR